MELSLSGYDVVITSEVNTQSTHQSSQWIHPIDLTPTLSYEEREKSIREEGLRPPLCHEFPFPLGRGQGMGVECHIRV